MNCLEWKEVEVREWEVIRVTGDVRCGGNRGMKKINCYEANEA